jgi:membrane-associated phospholipid phosphatase
MMPTNMPQHSDIGTSDQTTDVSSSNQPGPIATDNTHLLTSFVMYTDTPLSHQSTTVSDEASAVEEATRSNTYEYGTGPNIIDSIKAYLNNTPLVLELAGCFILATIGHRAPAYILRIQLNEREIPYQLTENGDVVLNMYINNPYGYDGNGAETVPDWLLIILVVFLPTILIIALGIRSRIKYDLHSSLCAFFFTLGSTEIITGMSKRYCGYLRPSFYSYCEFDTDTLECDSDSDNPRESFPSGHASTSMCSMTLLTLLLLGKIGLHHKHQIRINSATFVKKRLLSILSALPVCLGIFISVSRVHDNFHHPADIVGGSMIGIGCALFSHGLWYPSVYSAGAGNPLQAELEM